MTAVIILAAGESARLGQPKQNLLFEGQTLLQRAVQTGFDVGCAPVIVVLGAHADRIIAVNNVQLIHNPDWQEGMASSIRCGIEAIIHDESIEQAIIMPCDQPLVTSALINDLIRTAQNAGSAMVACSYQGITGPPVLFKKKWFTELHTLSGAAGAKNLLQAHPDEVELVEFAAGSIDIDTAEDYQRLIRRSV